MAAEWEGAQRDLWEQVAELCERHEVTVTWVAGARGGRGERTLRSAGATGGARNGLPADEGYEHPRSIPVAPTCLMRCRESARERPAINQYSSVFISNGFIPGRSDSSRAAIP